jgi:2Fe-2S ferredoxin
MPKVAYVGQDGRRETIEAAEGESVMETAVQRGVAGIVGECGGSMSCSTCHVYVDAEWLGQLAPIDDLEDEMLDGTAAERRPESRLSCQIVMTADLDGIIVQVPETQV